MFAREMHESAAKPYFADIPDVLPDESPAPAPAPPIELWSRVQGEPDTLGRVQRKRALALVVSLSWAAAQLAALGLRPDFSRLSAVYVLATLVAPFALGVAALSVALARGRLGLGARPSLVALLAIGGSLFVIGVALALPAPSAAASGLRSMFSCANLALAWAALPLVLAALALRGSFASSSVWRSALLGSAIGLGAAVAAQLRCPLADSLHVAVAHGGAVVVVALVSALLLGRLTRI